MKVMGMAIVCAVLVGCSGPQFSDLPPLEAAAGAAGMTKNVIPTGSAGSGEAGAPSYDGPPLLVVEARAVLLRGYAGDLSGCTLQVDAVAYDPKVPDLEIGGIEVNGEQSQETRWTASTKLTGSTETLAVTVSTADGSRMPIGSDDAVRFLVHRLAPLANGARLWTDLTDITAASIATADGQTLAAWP